MDNDEIRKRILVKMYDLERELAGNVVASTKLSKELNIPDEDVGFNIRFLAEEGYITADPLHSKTYSAMVGITPKGIITVENNF